MLDVSFEFCVFQENLVDDHSWSTQIWLSTHEQHKSLFCALRPLPSISKWSNESSEMVETRFGGGELLMMSVVRELFIKNFMIVGGVNV